MGLFVGVSSIETIGGMVLRVAKHIDSRHASSTPRHCNVRDLTWPASVNV